MARVSPLLTLALLAACTPTPEPTNTTTPDPPPGTSAAPEPSTAPEPSDDGNADESWQRGTVTIGPDGTHAIHADDDSVTVCAPELAPEYQQKGLAVRFQAELIPPAPNERRWCTLASKLRVERAQ